MNKIPEIERGLPLEVLAGAGSKVAEKLLKNGLNGKFPKDDSGKSPDSEGFQVISGRKIRGFFGGKTLVANLRWNEEECKLTVPLPPEKIFLEEEIIRIISSLRGIVNNDFPKEGYREIKVVGGNFFFSGNEVIMKAPFLERETLGILLIPFGNPLKEKVIGIIKDDEGREIDIFPTPYSFLGIYWGVEINTSLKNLSFSLLVLSRKIQEYIVNGWAGY
ncbi:MAG: hypothetical protein ACPLKP_03980 [Microgenomates group bacterium]